MTRKLPPLNSLKAFEASARHKNFTKAAEELFVTQGAVSKQVKTLEDYLGITVFERKHHNLSLTENGRTYLVSINNALNIIEQATDGIVQNDNQVDVLNIKISPTLSNKWLIPLIDKFKDKFPNINISIEASDCATDYDTIYTIPADIAICTVRAKIWKHVIAEKIMDEELLPICAPHLKISESSINNLEDLLKHNLLMHTKRPNMWEEYLSTIGFNNVSIKHSMAFGHFYMLIQAAIDGMGMALIPKILIEEELKQNKLVTAFYSKFDSPYHCYLIYPKHKAELKKIKNFRKWVKSCVLINNK